MSTFYIWTGDGVLFVFNEIHLDPNQDCALEEWYELNDIENMYTHYPFSDISWGEVRHMESPIIPVLPWKIKSESESESESQSQSESES